MDRPLRNVGGGYVCDCGASDIDETCRAGMDCRARMLPIKTIAASPGKLLVDRQALLDIVRALDIGAGRDRVPAAMDKLREPFFEDEMSSGTARRDGAVNSYKS